MKKIIAVILFLLFTVSVTGLRLSADSAYQSFEELNVYGGKLVSKWTDKEYKDYLSQVSKHKFMGWNVKFVYKDLRCTYITETLYSFYNDGFTAIDYHYSLKETKKTKFELSVTGSLKIDRGSKTKTKDASFDNGLDAQIKATVSYSNETSRTEEQSIKMQVDPKTKVDVYIYGEGKIFNGVASDYFFWIRTRQGAFEVFIITTQYYRFEKTRI